MKSFLSQFCILTLLSPPTRAEWIEIVDRYEHIYSNAGLRPHGRSGLKYVVKAMNPNDQNVSAHTGGVD